MLKSQQQHESVWMGRRGRKERATAQVFYDANSRRYRAGDVIASHLKWSFLATIKVAPQDFSLSLKQLVLFQGQVFYLPGN